MSEPAEIDINQIFLKAHKRAVKNAIELAARTHTSLVSHENGKVKLVKPNVKCVYIPVDPPKKKKATISRLPLVKRPASKAN